MNQQYHDQELEPQATYDSFPKEEYPFPIEQRESQQPVDSHMNGWDFLAFFMGRVFDWLEDLEWSNVWIALIGLSPIVIIILSEIFHWQ